MSELHKSSGEGHELPATAAQAGLGALPIGSIESRAVARLLLERRRISGPRFEVVFCCDWITEPSATDWTKEGADGRSMRTVSLPGRRSMEECLRQLGGYSDEEIKVAAEHCPIVPGDFDILMFER